ncbi:hypothetical protein GCM10027215_40110 [Nocardioides zeae]
MLEPGLVVGTSPTGIEMLVGVAGVADQVDDPVERGLSVDPGRFQAPQFGFEVGELSCQGRLFLAGDVGRDDAVHGVLGPLLAVALDLVDALGERAGVALRVFAQAAQVLGEAFTDDR